MINSEIKEVVYVAIGLMVASLVLGCVYMFTNLRDSMADTRNNEIINARSMANYREFNKYNDNLVHGEDVIEAIRNYYDTDVRIYIDSVISTGNEYYVEKEMSNIDDLVDMEYLQRTFTPADTYQAYLIFDLYEKDAISGVSVPMSDSKISSEVTAIRFIPVP